VLEYIRAVPPADSWALEITKDGRSARLHLHRKEVIAAQYGPLIGNGALMTVAGWKQSADPAGAGGEGGAEEYLVVDC